MSSRRLDIVERGKIDVNDIDKGVNPTPGS